MRRGPKAVSVHLTDKTGAVTPDDLIELAELLDRAVRAAESQPESGATEAEIVTLAATLGWPLPPGLAEWLRLCRGEAVGAGGVFGIRPDAPHLDMVGFLDLYPEWRDRRWSPIASDGCGNYFVLTEDGSVGFVDTMEQPTALRNVVAPSLMEFLRDYLARGG